MKSGFWYTVLFVVYTLINIGRYVTIGVLVAKTNNHAINNMDGHINECCSCLKVAKNPSIVLNKIIKKNVRFDLSYCVPEYIDCTTCIKENYPPGYILFVLYMFHNIYLHYIKHI